MNNPVKKPSEKGIYLKLNPELKKKIRIRAAERDITQIELITEYLEKGLKNDNKKHSK